MIGHARPEVTKDVCLFVFYFPPAIHRATPLCDFPTQEAKILAAAVLKCSPALGRFNELR